MRGPNETCSRTYSYAFSPENDDVYRVDRIGRKDIRISNAAYREILVNLLEDIINPNMML